METIKCKSGQCPHPKKTAHPATENGAQYQPLTTDPNLSEELIARRMTTAEPLGLNQMNTMLLHATLEASIDNDHQLLTPFRDSLDWDSINKTNQMLEMNLQNQINRIPSRFESHAEIPPHPLKHMFGKPVLYRDAKTVLTLNAEKFAHKLLCNGITLNPGDACALNCTYCYVGPQMFKVVKPTLRAAEALLDRPLAPPDVVIRRARAKAILKSQLFKRNGARKFTDPTDTRTVFCSTTVDPAATTELLHETAELCICILENTHWHIRLLSKSALLAKLVTDNLINPRHHHRLIFGFSLGTLDDGIARAIEVHTSSPKARLKALHELQDRGIRTFGMICPSLPQHDYAGFSAEICAAIRVERCEHVWAEVLNVRGRSLTHTAGALRGAGYHEEADQLEAVSGAAHKAAWEQYARDTFLAHARNIPKSKLRFLQYIDRDTASWWETQQSKGAVLIGKAAVELGLVASGESKKS